MDINNKSLEMKEVAKSLDLWRNTLNGYECQKKNDSFVDDDSDIGKNVDWGGILLLIARIRVERNGL